MPKVIDFGLAKAVGEVALTEQTQQTMPGSADRLAALADPQGENAYNAGCYLARCSALATKDETIPTETRSVLANDYAGRAIKHLQAAVSRGFRDPKAYATDMDFDSLRDRDDFKKLLADLEAKVRST